MNNGDKAYKPTAFELAIVGIQMIGKKRLKNYFTGEMETIRTPRVAFMEAKMWLQNADAYLNEPHPTFTSLREITGLTITRQLIERWKAEPTLKPFAEQHEQDGLFLPSQADAIRSAYAAFRRKKAMRTPPKKKKTARRG